MHRGSIFWGSVLVLLGALLLAQTMNLLPPNVNVWSIFWSLVLVAFGVLLLMRNIGASRPVVRGHDGSNTRPGASALSGEVVRLPLGEARRATFRFKHGAGELRID